MGTAYILGDAKGFMVDPDPGLIKCKYLDLGLTLMDPSEDTYFLLFLVSLRL